MARIFGPVAVNPPADACLAGEPVDRFGVNQHGEVDVDRLTAHRVKRSAAGDVPSRPGGCGDGHAFTVVGLPHNRPEVNAVAGSARRSVTTATE
jgi:hypothetical protein